MADISNQQLNSSITNLTREIQSLAGSIRSLIQSQTSYRNFTDGDKSEEQIFGETLSDAEKELVAFAIALRKGRVANQQQERLIKRAIEAKRQEIEARSQLKQQSVDHKQTVKSKADQQVIKQAADKISNLKQNHQSAVNNVKQAVDEVEKSFQRLTSNIDFVGIALTQFGAALTTQGRMLLAQNKANGGLIEGTDSLISAIAEQQNLALKYAVNSADFANITAESRQMLNALGGTTAGLQNLDQSINRFTIITGSFEQGLRMATVVARDFAERGIKPTQQVLDRYHDDLVAVRRQTGLSIDQAHQLYDSVANDIDSIAILRSARIDEREAILRSQRALIQHSVAAGMSADQAKEAAKAMSKIAAQKPIDRMQMATRVQAFANAVGIEGGARAARAIIAGKRITPEESEFLSRFNQQLANVVDKSGRSDIGQEIVITSLIDQLGLEQYFGKGSAFSTSLGQALENQAGPLDQRFIDVTKTTEGQTIQEGAKIVEQLKLIVSGQHWLGVIAGGVATIVAMMAKDTILGKLKQLIPGLAGSKIPTTGGVGAAGAGGAAAGGAAAASGLSKFMPLLKKAGLLGLAVDVGLGVKDIAEGKRQKEIPSGFDLISPMRWAMYFGDKIATQFEDNKQPESPKPDTFVYDLVHPEYSNTANQPGQPKQISSDINREIQPVKTVEKITETRSEHNITNQVDKTSEKTIVNQVNNEKPTIEPVRTQRQETPVVNQQPVVINQPVIEQPSRIDHFATNQNPQPKLPDQQNNKPIVIAEPSNNNPNYISPFVNPVDQKQNKLADNIQPANYQFDRNNVVRDKPIERQLLDQINPIREQRNQIPVDRQPLDQINPTREQHNQIPVDRQPLDQINPIRDQRNQIPVNRQQLDQINPVQREHNIESNRPQLDRINPPKQQHEVEKSNNFPAKVEQSQPLLVDRIQPNVARQDQSTENNSVKENVVIPSNIIPPSTSPIFDRAQPDNKGNQSIIPSNIVPPTVNRSLQDSLAKSEQQISQNIAENSAIAAEGISAQNRKADITNTMIRQLVDVNQKHLTIAEKQLLALTMTEQEKVEEAKRQPKKENRFKIDYNYVQ